MRFSDAFVDALIECGVDYVTCVSGGGIMYLVDSVGKAKNLQSRYLHHEQAAAFAAEGYTRATGKLSACLVTIGPGVANAVSGAFSCFLNSQPVLFISGAKRTNIQTNYHLDRFNFPQDGNSRAMVEPVVKGFWELTESDDVLQAVESATHVANSGRRGPVWISIPLDVQACMKLKSGRSLKPRPRASTMVNFSEKIQTFINKNKKTVLILGSGIAQAANTPAFRNVLKHLHLPTTCTVAANHTGFGGGELFLGVIGPLGRRAANHIINDADSLLLIGSRLDLDMTGFDRDSFFRNKNILSVNEDSMHFIREASQFDLLAQNPDYVDYSSIRLGASHQSNWARYAVKLNSILAAEREADFEREDDLLGVNPRKFAEKLSLLAPQRTAFVTGISLDIWTVSHSIRLTANSRIFGSEHCGQLGWDLPAGIGVADSEKFERVVYVTGDGSIMFNLQELATFCKTSTPITVCIYDNAGYNSIRISQDTHLDKHRYGSDLHSLGFPDWELLAAAFGFDYFQITDDTLIASTLSEAFRSMRSFVRVAIDPERNRSPRLVSKIVNGRFESPRLTEQFPPLDEHTLRALDSAREELRDQH